MSLKELKSSLATIARSKPSKSGGLSEAIRGYMTSRFRNADICRRTGLSSSTLSQWWNGSHSIGSNNLDLICESLGVKPFLPVHEAVDGFVTLANLSDAIETEAAKQEHDTLVNRISELEAENRILIKALTKAAEVLKTFQDEISETLEFESKEGALRNVH